MLSVSQALDAILAIVPQGPACAIPLEDALDLVLAEDVAATIDSPPFDKALMDGYAARSSDLVAGRATLEVIDEVTAGRWPARAVGRGQAIRIMTGAPMPQGADVVIPVEHCRSHEEDRRARVAIETQSAAPGRNVLLRGTAVRQGDLVLAKGSVIRPAEIGCLAEMGLGAVRVHCRPRAAVLATGDELVSIESLPGPGQIRNSNEIMLAAALRRYGATVTRLGIARDNPADLGLAIRAGLTHDLLVISGGVSAGKLDLVPAVLKAAGVSEVFHRVKLKPGQPLWFGVAAPEARKPPVEDQRPRQGCCVFGLPGNPVSSLVCCELFVRAALRRMMALEPALPPALTARLAAEHACTGDRPTYHPARLTEEGGQRLVRTVRWIGSADQAALAKANCLAAFPEGNRVYPAGIEIDVLPW